MSFPSCRAQRRQLPFHLVKVAGRVFTGREPVLLRTEGLVAQTAELVVIGNPSGLPLKVAGGASVRKNEAPFFFSANLDTFQGNSGSAVFNAQSGVVEGILVRGEEDFEANMALMCIEAKKCNDSECRGEDVSRITSIPEYAVKDALFRLAAKGDQKELEKLTKNKFWIDIYGKDGKTALMTAVENKRLGLVKFFLGKKADPKIADVNGNTVLHILAPVLNVKNSTVLKTLLDGGATLEEKNMSGETALLVAARSLNLEGVKALIKAGADKNALDKNGENVLFAFARKGDKKAVSELVLLGVDSSVRNTAGEMVDEIKKPGLFARLKK